MSGHPAIAVDGLTKRFGEVNAVESASFTVPFGSVTGFVGSNGSGKTTTMRMIVGLTIPTSGTARIDGKPYTDLAQPRRSVGCALDRLGAHPGLTAKQHLQIVAASAGLSEHGLPTVLAEVGLHDASNRKVATYSTGMKQRLAIAVALLADPPILILDEPASGLDPSGVRWLRNLVRSKADNGTAVFLSTHQLAELATVVDHLVVIDNGRICANEPTNDLLERTGTDRLEDAVFALSDPNYQETT